MEITSPHEIQRKILERLGYGAPQSFSELRGDVPSNKFAFHLEKLQEKDLVQKTDDRYELTRLGTEVLPYLKVENVERPITVVDLFLFSDGAVYLEEKEADTLDATAGTVRPPSTRATKEKDLVEHAERLYRERFSGPVPDLKLLAVFESTTRFPNGAHQQHILFYFGAAVEEAGDSWYTVSAMDAEEVLPGMADAAEHILDADGILHGIWDLAYDGGELELDRLEFTPGRGQ